MLGEQIVRQLFVDRRKWHTLHFQSFKKSKGTCFFPQIIKTFQCHWQWRFIGLWSFELLLPYQSTLEGVFQKALWQTQMECKVLIRLLSVDKNRLKRMCSKISKDRRFSREIDPLLTDYFTKCLKYQKLFYWLKRMRDN